MENTLMMSNNETDKKIHIKALNVETGEFQSKVLSLASGIEGECLIGRHQSCNIILNFPEVSRIHGRIFYLDGQCYFTDFGSTSGSQINGEQIQFNRSYIFKPNDLLRISQFVISFADIYSEEVESKPVWSSGEITVNCIRVIQETHDVKTFCFVAESPLLFFYKPGQFVTLNLLIDGKNVKRSYSLSSSPTRPYSIEITVKRVSPSGLVSSWLHDNIKVGSQVKVSSPMGKFIYSDLGFQKLLFISAGSGITPLMSMLRWLYDTKANVDIVFIHCARTPQDIIFRSELEFMAAIHPNLKLAVTITRLEFDRGWQGYTGQLRSYTGRLNEQILGAIAPDFRERQAYICGPDPFMKAIKTLLEQLDFPMSNYYQESFGSSPSKKKTTSNKLSQPPQTLSPTPLLKEAEEKNLENIEKIEDSPVVVLAKSGTEIICDREDSILDAAREKGIELPNACQMGVCGACRLPLSQGRVYYDDDPQCEPGYLLTCIAKARGRVVIDA